MDTRWAWRAKHASAAVAGAWSGPVHSTPLLAALPPGGRVLELGAGGGKVGRALPADALALDWVREGLRHAGARRPRLLADARRLPVRDAALDAVVAIHILGHLVGEDRRAALDEWRRATRPGGALVLEVFARGDARDGQGRAVEEGTWEREGVPTHYFDAAELTGLLRGWEGEVLLDEQERRWGTRRLLRGSFTRSPGDGASR